ncbi:tape measure protein [Dysgonomonas sp. 520]|uniref:tape measure protein n=1 Tax=Dysgonomonas sp. 520 TaxID=2302931 RepID=UPI0013D2701E|nr:tape measure protein [Dysgonomonas sp. 520]NDW10449.1 hypothetical protein [Dysgonomonas sp. 520]
MASIVEYMLRARDMLSPIFERASRAAQNTTRNINNLNNMQRGNQRSIERLSNAMNYLQQRRDRAFDPAVIGRYNTQIRRLQEEMQRLNNLPPRSFIDRIREGETAAGSLQNKFAGLIATVGLFKGAKSALKWAAELEQSSVAFEVLLGNAQQAKIMLDSIRNYSIANPIYDNAGLIESAKLMLGFGTSAEKILPNIKMFGDIAMGDAQKLNSLALVYTQIADLRKLQTQDWKQMAGAGFNVLYELEKMTGKSMDVLKSEMEKGKISIEMVDAALKHATSEGGRFFGMAERMGKTTAGQFNALTGSLKQTATELGTRLLPYANQLIQFLIPLVDWIGRNIDMIMQLTGVVLGAVAAYKIIIGVIKLWTIAQAILNRTMMLNPIGVVITVIAALAAGIIYCYNQFATFRGIVYGVWDSFKLFIKFIKDSVMSVVNGLVETFAGLGKVIQSVFSADWDGVVEGAKQASKGYTDATTGMFRSAYENGSKLSETFSQGYANGVAAHKAKNAPQFGQGLTPFNIPMPGTGTVNGLGGGSFSPDATAKGIAGSGSKPTNITINLQKELIGSLTIQALTASEGIENMEELVKQALSRILNSGNRIAFE